jgi:hypothetical protein
MVTFEEVSEIRMKKARQNHETYRELWERCSQKILANAKRNKQSTDYVLTPFVPGRPLINVHRAARYVRDKLSRRGFTVDAETREPFVVLHVDWQCFKDKLKSQFVKIKDERPPQADAATERLLATRSVSQPVATPKDHTDITDDILAILAK